MRKRPATYKIEWRGVLIVIRHELDYLWPGTSHRFNGSCNKA